MNQLVFNTCCFIMGSVTTLVILKLTILKPKVPKWVREDMKQERRLRHEKH